MDNNTHQQNIKKISTKMGVNCVKPRRTTHKHSSVVPLDNYCNKIQQNTSDKIQNDKKNLNIIYDKSTPESLSLKLQQQPQQKQRQQQKFKEQPKIPEIRIYSNIFDSSSSSTTNNTTIEWNNILHRRNSYEDDNNSVKIRKSSPSSSLSLSLTNDKNNIQLKSSNQNIKMNSIANENTSKRNSIFKNFNGSVQNLMNFVMIKSNFINSNERHQKSASENNLSNISNSKLNYKIDKFSSRSSTNLNYCPSVLYNRKQIAESKLQNKTNEKSGGVVNFKNWKKVFNLSKHKRLKDDGNHDT